MTTKTLISWNINGIRSIVQKGFLDWINKSNHSVICLQEIKADPSKIPNEILEHKNYHQESLPAERKGYSGVMTLSKEKPLKTEKGLSNKDFAKEGRTLISHFKEYIIVNCYFPNGGRDHSRVPYKMKYCSAVLRKIKKLQKENQKPVILCGDLNTAHHPIDLANPVSNKNTTGFLETERKWLDKLETNHFIDCFRTLYPQQKEIYSWWTYRNNCRERNIGWRIDYFFIDKLSQKIVKDCQYLKNVPGSDHCPVQLSLKL